MQADLNPVKESNNNSLFYGDNLTIMKNFPNSSIDLIYLDPPFNSKKTYNLMYKTMTGKPVPEQVEAFCDSWTMDAEKHDLMNNMTVEMESKGIDSDFIQFWQFWTKALRTTQPKLLAYLLYMTVRLLEMWRILKPTGSLYLHCDPTCSHYIKIILDGIFGHGNFRNEIIWYYEKWTAPSKVHYQRNHDIILFYSKSKNNYFNTIKEITENLKEKHKKGYLIGGGYGSNGLVVYDKNHPKVQKLIKSGKYKVHYADISGKPLSDVLKIPIINPMAKERLGYPTQKPIKLLDLIVKVSCPEDGVVLDPFCGCGTTIYATHESNFEQKDKKGILQNKISDRKWIGIDIAILSTKLVQETLDIRYSLKQDEHYKISGIPVSLEEAEYLFKQDPFQFENWSIEKVGGFCTNKKTRDGGIDGRIYFKCGENDMRSMVISVKGGRLNISYIRDLLGVMEREEAWFGGFISLQEPTKGMREEAAKLGMMTINGIKYERLQLLTIKDIIQGKRLFHLPNQVNRKDYDQNKQMGLNL